MKRYLILLGLMTVPLTAKAFDEKLKACKVSYQKFFPDCLHSFSQHKCLWEGLEAMRKNDVFKYRSAENDPQSEKEKHRYKATSEYKTRLKSLKRDKTRILRATFCFLEPDLVDYTNDIKLWSYKAKSKELKVLLRGVNQRVVSEKSYSSGFIASNLKPVANLDHHVFFSVDRFIGGGFSELFLTHTKIYLFFKIRSVRLKSYPNYDHPRYLSKNSLKKDAEKSGVSVKQMTDFLRKENSPTSKHIEVRVTDLLLCEDDYRSDQDCLEPFPLKVSSRGRIY